MQPGGSNLLTHGAGEKGITKEQIMKISSRITGIARHIMVLMLAVSLVTGLAAAGSDVYAASSTGSPFANTRKAYQHNSRFDGNLIVNGVDVSYFQSASSDWVAAKKNGCDFTIMRVTYTTYASSGNMYIDSKFATHFNRAKAAGVMKGVYVFSQAKNVNEARNEAQFAVNRLKALGIGPKDLELPVYMDYEFAGKSKGKNKGRLYGLKAKTAVECVNAFADVIRANGYDPGVYANTNFFGSYLGNGANLAADIDMWDAQYYNRNESPSNYTKWQYTSTAKVNGILYYSTNKIGSTDADFWYLNRRTNAKAITAIYGNTTLNYTGSPVRPNLAIYEGNTLLKEGVDYIVGGINNINEGTGAYAYVKGIGKYGGYALVPVTIGKGFINHMGLSSVGGAVFTNKKGNSYSIGTSDFGGFVRNIPAGTTAGTFLGKIKLKSSYKNKYTLAVIDAKGNKVDNGTKLSTGMMVGVYSGSTLKGTADITVNGDTLNNRGANYLAHVSRSSYSAPAAAAASVTVKATKIKKLSKGKKSFTVKVKKLGKSQANGYEVRYSTNKSMKNATVKTVGTKYNKVKKKIKGLKKKKTYYVQVRTYKIVNGNYYFSGWSKAKKVKTK